MFLVNDVQITPTIFPDKTSQVWLLPEQLIDCGDYLIEWRFENEGEFLQLAQLKDLFDQSYTTKSVSLKLKYLPYGRQDKEVTNKNTFALHSFSRLLNFLGFSQVYIMDPHSKIALSLIADSIADYPFVELKKAMELTNSDLVCYPDKGAREKYTLLFHGFNYCYGEKVRDQITGKITHYKLETSKIRSSPLGRNIMIMDDICDGGATFVLLAKELYAAGAKEVHLFVTHGIFSKGLAPLREAGIKRIFTQDGEKL